MHNGVVHFNIYTQQLLRSYWPSVMLYFLFIESHLKQNSLVHIFIMLLHLFPRTKNSCAAFLPATPINARKSLPYCHNPSFTRQYFSCHSVCLPATTTTFTLMPSLLCLNFLWSRNKQKISKLILFYSN